MLEVPLRPRTAYNMILQAEKRGGKLPRTQLLLSRQAEIRE